jgi:hypothetical protein
LALVLDASNDHGQTLQPKKGPQNAKQCLNIKAAIMLTGISRHVASSVPAKHKIRIH